MKLITAIAWATREFSSGPPPRPGPRGRLSGREAKIFVTRMLTRDLFAVANLIISIYFYRLRFVIVIYLLEVLQNEMMLFKFAYKLQKVQPKS